MFRKGIIWGCSVLAGVATTCAAADEARVTAFNTQVQVDIAADGRAHAISLDKRLPDSVRGPIERQVERWHFAPSQIEGKTVAATTYVSVAACLVPIDGDAMRLAVAYRSHGPGSDLTPESVAPPRYPSDAFRAGISARMQVQYLVQIDGKALVEKIDFDTPVGPTARHGFESALRQWLKAQRFKPESIDGLPVATRMQSPFSFNVGPAVSSFSEAQRQVQEQRERLLAEQALSPACIAASRQVPYSESLALDSRVTVEPKAQPGS